MRPQKAKAVPNQERILDDDLLRKLFQLLDLYRGVIRITLLRNIALLTHALLTLFHGARRPWPGAFPWSRPPREGNSDFPDSWITPV
jgi:hypothetical protein